MTVCYYLAMKRWGCFTKNAFIKAKYHSKTVWNITVTLRRQDPVYQGYKYEKKNLVSNN